MSIGLDLPARATARISATGRHRAARGRRRYASDATVVLAGLGAGAVAGSAWVLSAPTWSTPGGPVTVLGSLTAMVGTYLSLVLIVVVARVRGWNATSGRTGSSRCTAGWRPGWWA